MVRVCSVCCFILQQAKQIAGVGDSLISNFEYAMEHLVPTYNEVFFFHSKIDKMECIYSVVRKKYSDTIVYEIMVDHSNGFHKQVPYQLYKSIHPVQEVKGLLLNKNTVIEKCGWMTMDNVKKQCLKKVKPLLLNTAFCRFLFAEGAVLFSVNKEEDATGVAKKCFKNVLQGPNDATIYLGVVIDRVATPHAWLMDKEDNLIELTPRYDGLQLYFGVPIERKTYMERSKENVKGCSIWDLYLTEID